MAVIAIFILTASCQEDNGSVRVKCDSQIAAALANVSIDSVRLYIDDLVALHTRHTLSSQTNPSRGIGAAVAYLTNRCEHWADAATQIRPRPIVQPVKYVVGANGGRYDRIIEVPELMVTLPGTKAEREILLIAHIDTRVLDVMDSTTFAPGADDDGSGLACLFVSGEEQGLDGSRYFATVARDE